MRALFVIVFLYSINCAKAANYYFSSISGNDSRTPSEAQDPATPWRTLSKLNSFFSSLQPGDSVLLNRGETFYGSIIVKRSGSPTFPIVIGAYGLGDKPLITSLVTMAGWISKGKGIWESTDLSLGSSLNMVLLNGVEQEMGRYPNSDAVNNGYLNFESHVLKTSITDTDLNTSVNWKGAELVLRPRHWILNRNLITSQSGYIISYSTSSPYEPYDNYGYFIQNSIKTLDKFGEWYYNPITKKLSVCFGSKGPSAYVLQASATGDLVSSSSNSNIVFYNLAVKGSNSSGFFINNGSNINIKECDILFSGITGILVHNHKNLHVENCTIANSNNDAINLEYGVINAVIKNNKILNTAMIAGMMQNGEGNGLAIYANGDGTTIDSNEIRKTGFIGITFYGSDVFIKNNFIDSFCFVKDDGGGIYSRGGANITTNRKLIGNIIINGIGAGAGTDNATKRAVTGIYMDDDITNVQITGNTVATCYQGIFLQSSSGMLINNNTVFDNFRQITIIERAGDNPVRNTTITQNIFFSKTADEWASYIMSSADDINMFGRFDSNYYARPLDERLTIYNSFVGPGGKGIIQNLDLDGWKKTYKQDKHSKIAAKQIVPFNLDSLIGLNKFINGGDFTNDILGVSGSACTLTAGNSGKLDGGYLEVEPTARGSALYLKVDSVTAGKNYILSYSLRGSVASDMSLSAGLKQAGAPFTALTQVQMRKVDTTRTENSMIFSPSASNASTYLIFKADDVNKYYIDNIKFYEAKASITNPDDSLRFEYNATAKTKSVALNGNYLDVAGKMYSKTILLQPYTSAILLKSNKNIAPTVSIISPLNKAVFPPLSSVSINVTAKDADGSISKVELYSGPALLKTEFLPPYNCTLDSIAPGNYSITARAFDNKGVYATSSPVVFSVPSLRAAPIVKITTPGDSSVFTAPANIQVVAEASDADGLINKVEFFNGATLLTTESKPPYTCNWPNVAAGSYIITAKATGSNGLSKTSVGIPVFVQAAKTATALASRNSLIASNVLSSPLKISNIDTEKPLTQLDVIKLLDFQLSPNPAVSTIQLNFSGLQIYQKANLVIENALGAVVKKYPLIITGEKINVDVSSLSSGIYIISLSGNNFTVNKKFSK